MSRFSLRTLLILTAMLAVLLSAYPFMEHIKSGERKFDPIVWVFTGRFKTIATVELVVLVSWAGLAWNRRRTSEGAN